MIPFEPLWAQYKRIAKPNAAIVLTASQPFTTALISSNMAMFKYCLVWEKTISTGGMHAKKKPLKCHEDIAIFSGGTTVHASQTKRKMNYFPQMSIGTPYKKFRAKGSLVDGASQSARDSHVDYLSDNKGSRYPKSVLKIANSNHGSVHPTQKPVALMEYLIRTYTNEGETVLDSCMGSGTTGVGCVNTGRNFIGMEKDAAYFEIARQRIETAQLPLLQAA